MHIKIPYGSGQVHADVPDNWINGRCYRPKPLPPCRNAREELLAAMSELTGGESLSGVSAGKSTCVIAVDGQFPVLFQELLPAVIEVVQSETDIPESAITILVANRLLSPLKQQDLDSLVGSEIRERFRVVLHDPLDRETSEPLRTSSAREYPLLVNHHYLNGELKIILGGVRPDVLLGFTGGRAVLVPGLAGESTLKALFTYEAISNGNVRYGNFRDNPFHVAAVEALGSTGCDMAISAVLTPTGEVSEVHAGHYGKSHLEAMNALRGAMLVSLREPMDIVLTSGGGTPTDDSLLDLLETISGVLPVLAPGGTVVVSAALREGLGPPEFTELLRTYGNISEAIESLSSHDRLFTGHWVALRLYQLLEKHEIILFNRDLDENQIWAIGFTPARDLNEAVQEAMTSHGQRCRIVALPEGPSTLGTIG